MGKTLLKVLLVSAVLSIVFSISETRAEVVDHHGQPVDSDDTSFGCLSCHDGVSASSVSTCITECTVLDSHPIGNAYPPAGKEAKFVPFDDALDSGIRFQDEKVACVSCHDLINQAESHLRMPNDGSALCAACHRL